MSFVYCSPEVMCPADVCAAEIRASDYRFVSVCAAPPPVDPFNYIDSLSDEEFSSLVDTANSTQARPTIPLRPVTAR
jgi:hypothetical protein